MSGVDPISTTAADATGCPLDDGARQTEPMTEVESDAAAANQVGDAVEVDTDVDASPNPRPRRKIDVGLLVVSLIIAAALILIVWGMSFAVTGDDGIDRPDGVESVSPVENAVQVLHQDEVVVDLADGYEGVLIIDGIEIAVDRPGSADDQPGTQQLSDPTRTRFDPGNNVLSFRPAPGAPITEFVQGRHSVTLIYWEIQQGRGVEDKAYRWSFDVI